MKSEVLADPVSDPSEWGVGRCQCGCIVLRLGEVQKSFTPAEFAELHRLLQVAMQAFDVPVSPRGLQVSHGTTH